MRYDIVIVSYNSERWLPGCIGALAKLEYDLSQLHVIIVDNGSSQPCLELLHRLKREYSCFGAFTVEESPVNLGFGGGCNRGAQLGTASYILLLNVDTAICPDALTQLDAAIDSKDEKAGAFELRQKPWEFCHHHDPVTQEVEWNCGACVAYPRPVYEQVRGFDENIFLYCEDVDLSWRIRACGYRLYYVPRATAFHYTLSRNSSSDKLFREYIWNQYTKLMLHYKYCGWKECLKACREYLHTLRYPPHFPHVRKVLLKNFLRHFLEIPKYAVWRYKNKEIAAKVPVKWVHGFTTMRGRYTFRALIETPLVSVCIRAGAQPDALRRTLCSLRNQTYENFEVVLQQDGTAIFEELVQKEFADLRIRYEANGAELGAAKTGNRALARATGAYLLLANAGDLFYAEHLELMVTTFQAYPEAELVLNGYVRRENEAGAMTYEEPARLTLPLLCSQNPIPLCTAAFRRELYEKAGGLSESMKENEAWDMWLRFFAVSACAYANPRATSLVQLPDDAVQRETIFRKQWESILADPALVWKMDVRQLSALYYGAEEAQLAKLISIYDEWPEELKDL